MNVYEYEDLLKGKVSKEDLANKTFCFTGKTSKPRWDLEMKVMDAGAIVKSSITKKLDYLVIPDSSYWSLTTKYYEAQDKKVKIIKESEFLKMVGNDI